jgi:hypothetical protein
MSSNIKEIPRYTLAYRLNDVIALITVLALDKTAFRTEDGLKSSLRSNPVTVENWFKIVEAHPEFFRTNGGKTHIALLLRSYFEEDDKDGVKSRAALTTDETQKLIASAFSLHDKELARLQKNAYKVPIRTAVISGIFLIVISLINSSVALYTNHTNTKDIDSLKASTQRIELKLNKAK